MLLYIGSFDITFLVLQTPWFLLFLLFLPLPKVQIPLLSPYFLVLSFFINWPQEITVSNYLYNNDSQISTSRHTLLNSK